MAQAASNSRARAPNVVWGKSAHVPRMARQKAQEQTESSMVDPERFSDRAHTCASRTLIHADKQNCEQTKTHLCGTCRKIENVSKRLTTYKHYKHPGRALICDTTTRARPLLGLPHFLAKRLVPRPSAYEMRTDPRKLKAVDPNGRPRDPTSRLCILYTE